MLGAVVVAGVEVGVVVVGGVELEVVTGGVEAAAEGGDAPIITCRSTKEVAPAAFVASYRIVHTRGTLVSRTMDAVF